LTSSEDEKDLLQEEVVMFYATGAKPLLFGKMDTCDSTTMILAIPMMILYND
jgi:hypothetical protein